MLWVCALKALQNSMILTPRWPSAGPTGGDGIGRAGGNLQLDLSDNFFRHLTDIQKRRCERRLRPRILHC